MQLTNFNTSEWTNTDTQYTPDTLTALEWRILDAHYANQSDIYIDCLYTILTAYEAYNDSFYL